MTKSKTQEGGCSCGQIRYRMTDRPLFVHCCHCRMCQRQTGAAFALNAMIEANAFEVLSGETEATEMPSKHPSGQIVHRCPSCRVAVWSHYQSAGERIHFVRVGSLDAPDTCPPDVHIFTVSKQPWVELSGDVPAVPVFYDAADLWPAESLARRDVAMAET